MKIRNIALATISLSLAMSFSGCALFDKSEKYVVKGSEGVVVGDSQSSTSTSNTTSQVLTPPTYKSKSKATSKTTSTTATEKKQKAVKNKKTAQRASSAAVSKLELTTARREAAIAAMTTDKDSAAAEIKKIKTSAETVGTVIANTHTTTLPADFTINGEWTIYSVRGNIVTGEERPYLTFDLDAKRFYGSNGCNVVNGDLATDTSANSLLMQNIITTMQMCGDAPYEYLINLAISEVKTYSARQEGSITFLDLKSSQGQVLMVLRRHNMDFLNGAWKVTALNGTELTDDATMTIDITDWQIHGTTGCNIFNGSIFIDPDKVDSMQFINLATTRKACPESSRETEFLLALEVVETAKKLDANNITMYDTEGNELFHMQPINIRHSDD
jgi:heat shock protein HslJ